MSDLVTAIEQQINLGAHDPFEIAKKLEHQNGPDWVAAAVQEVAYEVVVDYARRLLGNDRRAKQRAGDDSLTAHWVPPADPQEWVDGHGWKRLEDMTAEDHDRRAAHYRKLEAANGHQAERHERFAWLLRKSGAETLADLEPSEWREAA